MRAPKPAEVEQPTRRALRVRLEEAGATLLAIPGGHGPAKYRSNLPEPVREAMVAYGRHTIRVRPPLPSAAAISRMDEAMGWVALIEGAGIADNPWSAGGNALLRRLVHCRLLVDPMSWHETPLKPIYLFKWSDLAALTNSNWRSVKLWHGAALGLIEGALAEIGVNP
jgi:hypothetical protein